ncbi:MULTISPECIES: AraC family transcriptional regulator [Lysinibacillus]|uniref:helix-turn-helix domain-containing protein n=1 Tax=Lysinibacillus TaxID=400634 RepID=UPI0008825EB7|nr:MULTISPECIES: AraC family transcriptional regulator [unclassified Lysinibacillus]MEE3806924.1 AraC family transcriptional regulator [Lysinibacillus fusiformis]SCX80497.1 AraC-type DNA-binding protein [Lysinibacillus sp. SG9]SDB03630.1 AraC-type DNA-binding protein [Lysinibacillus sp. TC-37]SFS32185.1 AraC-type DNA-binding protein [Lysinibacillus sp. SG55]
MESSFDKQQMSEWLKEVLPNALEECKVPKREDEVIIVYEVNRLFDWVKINRLKRNYPNSIIVPIVTEHLTYSTGIAIELVLPALLIKPLQKSKFLRIVKKLYTSYQDKKASTLTMLELSQQVSQHHTSPFREAFLKRLIRGEIDNEQEIIQSASFLSTNCIPNIVLLIQGYIDSDAIPHDASSNITNVFRQHFANKAPLSFLYFERYLLLLMRIPTEYNSFKHWTVGESCLLEVIETLKKDYCIHLFMGVGGVFQDAMHVKESYSQARKARRKPPIDNIHIRYYEDLTKHVQLQKAIHYIEEHYDEQLTVRDVAKYISFSPTHFSRLFKKETGRNFVDYVAFTRLIKSLPFLRKYDYTVEKISSTCGFNTPNYYSLTFKKYVGISPTDYRNTTEILFK